MHLSCTDTNTISKWTTTRFHLTHITLEIHRVRPKWFLSLWYDRRKPSNFLASRLALSPNGPKRASNWALSPRSTIRCVQKDFWAYGTFSANLATILHRHKHDLQIDCNEILHDPCHLGVPSAVSIMILKPMVCSTQTMHLPCIKISTISKQTKVSIH
jgi:hypothetical protein